jgi:DNA-binding GntR family transcriptional regulator
MADPTAGNAEYQRVAEGLRKRVRVDRMQPGDEMPSLQEIMTGYNVTVMVARRALFELRADGLISTRQGKRAVVVDPKAANTQSDDVVALTRQVDALQDRVRQQDEEMAQMRAEISGIQAERAARPGKRGSSRPAK